MPSRTATTFETPSAPIAGPSRPANPEGEGRRRDGLKGVQKLWGTTLVLNEGSTTRDYLARERNFLSWVKLCGFLALISASLLIRFQFGKTVSTPNWQVEAEIPLGILFFVATIGSLFIGSTTFFTSATGYSQNKAFVYGGRIVDVVLWGVGLLTITACVLLLAADGH
ncbi:hypothetical protein JCM6882_002464 [Rhodosporidiobolus microsporus]